MADGGEPYRPRNYFWRGLFSGCRIKFGMAGWDVVGKQMWVQGNLPCLPAARINQSIVLPEKCVAADAAFGWIPDQVRYDGVRGEKKSPPIG